MNKIFGTFKHSFYDKWLQTFLSFTNIYTCISDCYGEIWGVNLATMHLYIGFWTIWFIAILIQHMERGIAPTNYWIPKRFFGVYFFFNITSLLIQNAIFATKNSLSSSFCKLSESPISFYGLYGLISGQYDTQS